jgi:hypothetical protein
MTANRCECQDDCDGTCVDPRTPQMSRAAYHLNRRRAVRPPRAEGQPEGLFAEPQPQPRRLVWPGDGGLFVQPSQHRRGLVAVDGWPDYRDRDGAA